MRTFHGGFNAFELRLAAAMLALAAGQQTAAAATVNHINAHPQIQMYSYPAASANGAGAVRDRAPTFGAFSGLNQQGEPVFYQGDGYDPSRRGSFLIASNTGLDIPAGLAPERYRIDSLRITTTFLGGLIYEPLGYVLEYDPTLDESHAIAGGDGDADAGRPMEMYGLGLQGDYEIISFDATQLDKKFFQVGDVRWKTYQPDDPEYDPNQPNAISPYQFFALDLDGRDAENSVYGGYSATEVLGVASQFTPAPFAIGKLQDSQGGEAAPGTLMANGDKFVYEPNLADARVTDYIQRSLAEGYLGFSFSSLHEPAGHEGTVPYPDFYLDDLDVGNNPNGAAPRMELTVTILDAALAGDYDRNGIVDGADVLLWQQQLGTTVDPVGSGADGLADGIVDAADLAVWQDVVAEGGSSPSVGVVPEPAAGALLMTCVAICGVARRRPLSHTVGTGWRP